MGCGAHSVRESFSLGACVDWDHLAGLALTKRRDNRMCKRSLQLVWAADDGLFRKGHCHWRWRRLLNWDAGLNNLGSRLAWQLIDRIGELAID